MNIPTSISNTRTGMADCFQKLTDSCYTKCIPNVKEATLQAGEQSCVDRCVSKYLDVHQIVGKELQTAFAAQAGAPSAS